MSIKRILAAAAASVVAVSAMSVAAFAADAVTFVDKTGKATMADSGGKGENTRVMWNTVDLLPEGVTIDQVYGFTVTFSGEYDTEAGMGGSFIFSTKGKNWNGVEWGNADAGKAISFDDAAKTLTRLETEPFFTETDISGAEGEYAQVVIDAWWGSGELTIESVTALDKDGKALAAGAPADGESKPEESESKPEESESKPEESKSEESTSAPANNVETGVEGVAAVVGVAAVAAGALVVAKKRK